MPIFLEASGNYALYNPIISVNLPSSLAKRFIPILQDEETEAQRDDAMCTRLVSGKVQNRTHLCSTLETRFTALKCTVSQQALGSWWGWGCGDVYKEVVRSSQRRAIFRVY